MYRCRKNCMKLKIVLLSDKSDLMFRAFYTFIQTTELMIIIVIIVYSDTILNRQLTKAPTAMRSKRTCHDWSVDMPRLEYDLECYLSKTHIHPVLNSAHTSISATDTLYKILNSLLECHCFLYSHVVGLKLQVCLCGNADYNGQQGHEWKPAVQWETSVPQTLSTTNPTRTGLGRKPSLRVQKWVITPPPPTGMILLQERSGIARWS
jgi:hypothetical protein